MGSDSVVGEALEDVDIFGVVFHVLKVGLSYQWVEEGCGDILGCFVAFFGGVEDCVVEAADVGVDDVPAVGAVVLSQVFLVFESSAGGAFELVGELFSEFVTGPRFPLVGASIGVEVNCGVVFLEFVPGILGWVFGWHFYPSCCLESSGCSLGWRKKSTARART